MLDYLHTNGFHKTYDQFKAELPNVILLVTGSLARLISMLIQQADFQPDPSAKTSGLLAKKWTSVIRMQKKVRARCRHYRLKLLNNHPY